MDEIVVGCPVYKRAWVLPRWFDHVEKAFEVAGFTPTYAFVVDDRDEETIEVISNHHGGGFVFSVQEKVEHSGERTWNPQRFIWMAELRNELLGIVRLAQPPYFLSVDSDILLHEQALVNLLETIEHCDAVGGKTYLSETGNTVPNWANLSKSGGLKRYESSEVMAVQILMALKLMTPAAYAVDYSGHEQGEDIGWSLACRSKGLKFLWDGRVASKHIMRPDMLDKIDKRVGY